MKYCPYCGADLPGSAVSFCSECGKSVNHPAEGSNSQPDDSMRNPVSKPAGSPQHPSQSGANAKKGFGQPSRPPEPAQKSVRTDHRIQSKKPPAGKQVIKPASAVRPRPDKTRRPSPERATTTRNPMDENYDGYYDNVPTADNGQTKEPLDPELIKRIALIAGGAVVMVILSIIIMYVL